VDATSSWATVLELIRARVKPQQFETWFPQLKCLSIDATKVVVATPNEFFRRWVETHYLAQLKDACFQTLGSEPRFELLTLPALGNGPVPEGGAAVASAAPSNGGARAAPAEPRSPDSGSVTLAPAARTASLSSAEPVAHREAPQRDAAPEMRAAPRVQGDIILNQQYIFDNFVVGHSNRLAHAAAIAVSESPGRTYNPLFLHGGVGLGKTHLLQAVCHAILAKNPSLNVVYLSCEAFVNQYIAAIQRGSADRNAIDTFRERYRAVDMLLIDDIHFLGNKDASQEEFFHTFNTLYHAQKQIILSSDSPPQDIPALEQRLVSRFKWGLVAEIDPPHFETKVAIIRAKALARGRELTDDVAKFLAEALDSNIREIEGAVTKVIVLAGLQNVPIDVALCRDALRELTRKPGQMSLMDIMTHVANHYQVKVNELLSKKRSKAIALPRQVSMYLARMLTHLSLEEIGCQVGGRDHTTVLYAEGKIRELRERDAEMRQLLEKLTRELQRHG